MNRVPPFVPNSADDTHCVNAVFRMVFQYFFDQDFSWAEIDKLSHAVAGKGTWTFPISTELARRGLDVTNIEPTDYRRLFAEGESYLREVYGEKTAQYYLERSNIASVIPLIPEFLELVHHKTRKATEEEIRTFLADGCLVGAEVNSALLNDYAGFNLHFVLLYDAEGDDILLHDPGLPAMASRRVSGSLFHEAFCYPGGSQAIDVFRTRA